MPGTDAATSACASRVDLTLHAGECAALTGDDAECARNLLLVIHGRLRPIEGRVLIRHDGAVVDMARADAGEVLDIRRRTAGLYCAAAVERGRTPVHEAVLDAARWGGAAPAEARYRSGELLRRLGVSPRWWGTPVDGASRDLQARVSLACLFATRYPILLLDRPCDRLDLRAEAAVEGLIEEALDRGAAVIASFARSGFSDRFAGFVHRMPSVSGNPRPAA